MDKCAWNDKPKRFFIGTDFAGEIYLVPAEMRMEWDEWDTACEQTSELLPAPEWARLLNDPLQ